MDLRTLRYFSVVAQEENMSKAAEILHVTQPTLSKAIKNLETELGKQLFKRGSFKIVLTPAGRLLEKRATDLLKMATKIEREFKILNQITGGELYLGLAESWQIRYIAREVAKLKQSYPDVRYHVTSGDTEQLISRVDSGLLDFAVLAEQPDYKKYAALALPASDTWGLVVPITSVLATKEAISFEDLRELPLLASE